MSRQGKIFLIIIFIAVLFGIAIKAWMDRPKLLGEEGGKVMCDHCDSNILRPRPADKLFRGEISALYKTAEANFANGNYIEGIVSLRQAAEQGDVHAQAWLGAILLNHPRYTVTSIQAVKDCGEAKKWLTVAADATVSDINLEWISEAKESLLLWDSICKPEIALPKGSE